MHREWVQRVQKRLLFWFSENRRDLPWRREKTPYAILVSEVLLQQTTVDVAISYFERFLDRFPTLQALAEASLGEVLEVLAGIGYYARARYLHETARRLVTEFKGQIPPDFETLQGLPGIGRYTAGAIASIAFGQKVPALDTNAIRVLARLLGWRGDPKSSAFQKRLWKAAIQFLPDEDPGAFNQALMDFASLVCLPNSPRCSACPLSDLCRAYASGTPISFPSPPAKRGWKERREVACVIWRAGKILVARREKGWWQGLWECPRGEQALEERPLKAASRIAAETVGLTVTPERVILTLRHTVTNHRITLTAVQCRSGGGKVRLKGYGDARWVSIPEALLLPSPSPQRKLLRYLMGEEKKGRQLELFGPN